ncbi:MAG: hypothetical protein D4R67_10920 [Bacteroidetes bacterium]|nr:MAG: hypothetical protein D4R67_10920 [Bacteroidota bacterium]
MKQRTNATGILLSRYVKINISVFFSLVLLLLLSCKKEPGSTPPKLVFLTDSGYVSQDTTLAVGQKIRVGIDAQGAGANITYFHIGWNTGAEQTVLDSGMNQPQLTYTYSITKTASETEGWIFLVMDRDRNFSTIGLTLFKSSSSQYGPIRSYPGILLGAQTNPEAGSFFSLIANHRYFLDEAFLHQDSIDLIYYFDQYDATLSSPAEADAPAIFGGPTGLVNWTVKNETRYDTTGIAPDAVDLATNDSLILAAYEPVNLKRKAKFVQPGMVISFKDPAGRLGLILVKELVPGPDGYLLMDLIIQQN